MLISPIMGPVVGLAYGSTINDWDLVKKSIRVELVSLLVCVLVGVIIGILLGPVQNVSRDWPTQEMSSRGDLGNFYMGLPIAFFSGLGVAVSLLDDQTSSLVGVAISASLLPPAVNAGILWVAYLFTAFGIIETQWIEIDTKEHIFEEEHSVQSVYRSKGATSLFLTIANILLVWASSMIMFRLKEKLPINKKVSGKSVLFGRIHKTTTSEVIQVTTSK